MHVFEALLTACEQRGLLDCEYALPRGFEGLLPNHDAEICFGAATQYVAAMHLAKANSGRRHGVAAFTAIWQVGGKQRPPPMLDPWPAQDCVYIGTIIPSAPYFKV